MSNENERYGKKVFHFGSINVNNRELASRSLTAEGAFKAAKQLAKLTKAHKDTIEKGVDQAQQLHHDHGAKALSAAKFVGKHQGEIHGAAGWFHGKEDADDGKSKHGGKTHESPDEEGKKGSHGHGNAHLTGSKSDHDESEHVKGKKEPDTPNAVKPDAHKPTDRETHPQQVKHPQPDKHPKPDKHSKPEKHSKPDKSDHHHKVSSSSSKKNSRPKHKKHDRTSGCVHYEMNHLLMALFTVISLYFMY